MQRGLEHITDNYTKNERNQQNVQTVIEIDLNIRRTIRNLKKRKQSTQFKPKRKSLLFIDNNLRVYLGNYNNTCGIGSPKCILK